MDPFELGVRAVLGQQVSVSAATRLAGRLVEAHGRPVPGIAALGLTHLFPEAHALASADLTGAGVTAARTRAIGAFADAVACGKLALDGARSLVELVDDLRALPGFGDWTANYVAMRACRERDAFPASDLGIRHALDEPDVRAVEARAERWRPWRAYAAVHLWSAPRRATEGGRG
jgi:AraC family transcriptional regulator of adaptative response / DNA-3-methyladenine glycosylase II